MMDMRMHMRRGCLVAGVVAGVMGALLAGLAVPAGAQGIYTCTDSKGRRITSDRPIAECNDRVQKQLNPSGTVRREIAPSLTAQERAAAEVRAKQAAEERDKEAEERKRTANIAARYPDRASHDKERGAQLKPLDDAIKAANTRIAELHSQRQRLDAEGDFYKRDPTRMPAALKRQVDDNEQQVATQKRVIAGKEDEKKAVNMRFDEELAQLRKAWALQGKS